MIRPPSRALSQDLYVALARRQAKLDALPGYAERVATAKSEWEQKPASVFDPVRDELQAMCPGEDRCMYCEDSFADQIEHVRPKDLYPEQTFRWENYLYVCAGCNRKKSSRFAVLAKQGRCFVEVTRRARAPVVPPQAGLMVFLDPREEEPLRYLTLDLASSFEFFPRQGRGCVARARAWYTIDVLNLNSDTHCKARRRAFGRYVARLKEYVAETDEGVRRSLEQEIKAEHHPTVWREMKRQRMDILDLRRLFEQIPTALGW